MVTTSPLGANSDLSGVKQPQREVNNLPPPVLGSLNSSRVVFLGVAFAYRACELDSGGSITSTGFGHFVRKVLRPSQCLATLYRLLKLRITLRVN
jgi:hypothetical protein